MTWRLCYEATDATPALDVDLAAGRISLSGESYPENALDFYQPLLDNLRHHADEIADLAVSIDLSYSNTTTMKVLMDLVEICEEMSNNNTDVMITWYYLEADDRSPEIAQDLFEDASVPHQLVAISKTA